MSKIARFAHTRSLSVARLTLAATLLLLALVPLSDAQTTETSGLSQLTPPSLAPGSPDGSYALSGFDDVNLHNGNLNFNLPLYKVGGRGVGYTMMLSLSSKKWNVHRTSNTVNGEEVSVTYSPVNNWWTPHEVGYGPGLLVGRQTGGGTPTPACVLHQPIYGYTLTRLTFTGPDGSEYELIDAATMGRPYQTQPATNCNDQLGGFNRGRVFVSTDGSAATFISDTDIHDVNKIASSLGYWVVKPTGYLLLADGMRYRINNGQVDWIEDRNGNRMTFEYVDEFNRVTRVVDPLGRVVTVAYDLQDSPHGLHDEIQYVGFSGVPRTIYVSHGHLGDDYVLRGWPGVEPESYQQLFPELNGSVHNSQTFDPVVPTTVWLPGANLKYQIHYNVYGEVARVDLPTGGAFEYDYTPGSGARDIADDPNGTEKEIYRRLVERRTYANGTDIEGITGYTNPDQEGLTVTVDHYDANRVRLASETHQFNDGVTFPGEPTFISFNLATGGKEFQTDEGLTAKRRVQMDWVATQVSWPSPIPNTTPPSINPRVRNTTMTLLDVTPNLVSKQHFEYDQYNNKTEVFEYDFGPNAPGGLLRHTNTTYITTVTNANGSTIHYDTVNKADGSPYTTTPDAGATIHVRNLPGTVTVDNGSTQLAQTTFEYDNYSPDTNHVALQNCPGILGHDSDYSTGKIGRGNLTKTSRWLNTGGMVETYQQYDIVGNAIASIDGNGNTSNTTYLSAFQYAWPTQMSTPPPDPAGATGASTALGMSINYDFSSGRVLSTTDANGQATYAAYTSEGLDRLAQVTRPDGGTTTYTYNDQPLNVSVETKTKLDATQSEDGYQDYDGLGRAYQTRQIVPEGTILTTKNYDAMGRVYLASTPYRMGGESPVQTQTGYDDLSRVKSITTQTDNATVYTYYSANQVLVVDQANKRRISQMDAAGRMTDVWEVCAADGATVGVTFPGYSPTITAGYRTHYQYDGLDDLTAVTQQIGTSGTTQTRSFTYDSLKRLKSATNPESGTVNYTVYDGDSNLQQKTDARGITTNYTYDALSRLVQCSYSNDPQQTPTVNLYYDSKLPNPQTVLPGAPTYTPTYALGRLTATTYGGGSSNGNYFSYDLMGRPVSSYQQTDGVNYQTGYGYNLAGEMTSETYPSGKEVRTIYDGTGRVSGVSRYIGGVFDKTYASQFSYTSHGAVAAMQLGNGKWEHTSFNRRLQPTEIGLGNAPGDASLLKLIYDYGMSSNNGDVLSQTIKIGDGTASPTVMTQTYGYDDLNRLTSADEGSGSWLQTYAYDRFGNRAVTTSTGYTLNALTPISLTAYNTSNNQLRASSYDGAGNQYHDGSSRSFIYDGENRQLTFNGTAGQYVYDSDGHRVKKTDSTGTIVFVYDASGQLIAEYASGGASGSGTSYITADHLGSTRVVTSAADQSGQVTIKARYDYLPFGEELSAGIGQRTSAMGYGGSDTTRQKFTGKERDSESGLDYFGARYYSGAQGRFTSVDPLLASGGVHDPQTWNRYAYTLNNPMIYIDPSGLYVYAENTDDKLKSKFEKGLEGLRRARDHYRPGTREYNRLNRALNAYGAKGVNNGVTVRFAAADTPGHTNVAFNVDESGNNKATTADNPTGQNITVTIDPSKNSNNDDYTFVVAHEGSHVADGSDFVGALPKNLTHFFSSAPLVLNDETKNLRQFATEFRAYEVSSFVAEALVPNGNTVIGKDNDEKYQIWNSGWAPADRDRKRTAGIFRVLALPKDKGGVYGVTPFGQGKKFTD